MVLDLDAGLTLDAAARAATQADEIIKQHPEVITTYVTASPNEARIFVQLSNKSKRKDSIEDIAAQSESDINPFAIMFSLPLAVVGAILGLFLMGSDLSLVSMIGIIMLMGLVTKNAILLIDFIKQARARGIERNEAVRQAAATRLRPIMMTSLAMILGMMPVAMSLGAGTEWRAPMAHAMIGGLITSTLLTLVAVPVIYTLLDDLIQWRRGRHAEKVEAQI